MFLLVLAVEHGLEIFLSPAKRASALIIVFVAVIVGGIFYALVAIKSHLAHKILGDKIVPILEKLHVKI